MTKPQSNSTSIAWRYAFGVGVLAFALYASSISFGFTGYDDNDYVTDNPYVQRGVSGESIVWAFTTGHAANWHPVTWLSHAMDWEISGERPWMHHVTNVLLHAANSSLLFLLLYRYTGALWPSLFAAALFAVHPINVQSVAWVAERKNVLSTFFGLASLIAYSEYATRRSIPMYCAAGAFLALGLMSKPMLVTWPFVMLLLDYWPLQRIAASTRPFSPFLREMSKYAVEKVPFFILVLLSSVTTYLVQASAGAMGEGAGVPMLYRVGNAVIAYAAYLGKTSWPFGFAAFYPHPLGMFPLWKVAVLGVFLLAIAGVVIQQSAKRRYLFVGWFLYVGTLVPVIGIVQVGAQSMADRYAYVPLIGIFIAIAWTLNERAYHKRALLWLGVAVVAALGLRTAVELRHWRNGITLWEHATAVTSNNYIAHNNLGTAYKKAKMLDEAVPHFVRSLEISPNHAGALINMGQVLLEQNRVEQAIQTLEKAAQSATRNPEVRFTLASAYFRGQRFDKAMEQAMLAQSLDPSDPKVYNLLGIISDVQGRREDAIRYFQQALAISPGLRSAEVNLERLWSRKPAG
ncbi:MAG: tetratricopeptide repeat protein [Candidatus Hydrogenedentes bacterium]|nr:tetratricopeptide repeat protein [Candidatus Hydrogenedentota bacterium]